MGNEKDHATPMKSSTSSTTERLDTIVRVAMNSVKIEKSIRFLSKAINFVVGCLQECFSYAIVVKTKNQVE